MIVTVSGMVGSGKSTAATQIQALLGDAGHDATLLRFQSLPCFTLLRRRLTRHSPAAAGSSAAPAKRWTGYSRKRLTLAVTTVYLARIVACRIYCLAWPSRRWHVLNRYFYDVFAHYHLTSASERRNAALIRAVMPVPDLAILVVAAPATIAGRRPTYSADYLSQVAAAYNDLRLHFPELIEVRTDAETPTRDVLAQLVASYANEIDGPGSTAHAGS
jgi:hypothetical protein